MLAKLFSLLRIARLQCHVRLPQPPDQIDIGQTLDEEYQLLVVDVLDRPKVLDMALRFIYPGVDPPTITEPPTLTALLLMADNTRSCRCTQGDIENVPTPHTLWAYITACQFEFSGETKEAAKGSKMNDFLYHRQREDISSADLFQLVRFLQKPRHEVYDIERTRALAPGPRRLRLYGGNQR